VGHGGGNPRGAGGAVKELQGRWDFSGKHVGFHGISLSKNRENMGIS